MIYTPQKNPKEAMILVAVIVAFGIAGSFTYQLLTIAALLFWIQYTAILSYLQYKRKSRHNVKGFTGLLLNPQFRFFLFEFIAVIGLLSIFKYETMIFAIAALIAWFLFSFNFYRHYSEFRKYQ